MYRVCKGRQPYNVRVGVMGNAAGRKQGRVWEWVGQRNRGMWFQPNCIMGNAQIRKCVGWGCVIQGGAGCVCVGYTMSNHTYRIQQPPELIPQSALLAAPRVSVRRLPPEALRVRQPAMIRHYRRYAYSRRHTLRVFATSFFHVSRCSMLAACEARRHTTRALRCLLARERLAVIFAMPSCQSACALPNAASFAAEEISAFDIERFSGRCCGSRLS